MDEIASINEKYNGLSRPFRIRENSPSGACRFNLYGNILAAIGGRHTFEINDISPSGLRHDIEQLLENEQYAEVFGIFEYMSRVATDYSIFLIKHLITTRAENGTYIGKALFVERKRNYFIFFQLINMLAPYGYTYTMSASGGAVNGHYQLTRQDFDNEPVVLEGGYYSFRNNKFPDDEIEGIEAAISSDDVLKGMEQDYNE